jgi:hypothetical protein
MHTALRRLQSNGFNGDINDVHKNLSFLGG